MELRFLPAKEIPDDTLLWRYMRLSAFLLLLRKNTVFIPSLHKLQQDDPKEMRIRQHSVRTEFDCFFNSAEFLQARDWLDKKFVSRVGSHIYPERNYQNASLLKEWLYQLSIRRCAWCWFMPPEKGLSQWMESMAMWSFYARDGVAIGTTLERIETAIHEPGLREMLVAEIQYCAQGGPDRRFDDPDFTTRPFLFKSISYEHEKEVRLIFPINPASVSSGHKVKVEAKTLLEGGEIVISPYAMPDEADALIEVTKDLLPGVGVRLRPSAERASKPHDPRDDARLKESLSKYCLEPFSEDEDLPNLLREL